MDNNGIERDDRVTYIVDLVTKLPDAITHRLTEHADLQRQLAELNGKTCTGTEHWRDAKKEGHTRKLYIIHRIDQSCSVHGTPQRGKRLRIYVGNKLEKIEQARAAIEYQRQYCELTRQLSRHNELVNRILYKIKDLYWKLDYVVSQTDLGIPPYPIEADPSKIGEKT